MQTLYLQVHRFLLYRIESTHALASEPAWLHWLLSAEVRKRGARTVGESLELGLDGRGEMRVLYDRVHRCFGRELRVELPTQSACRRIEQRRSTHVARVDRTLDRGLERRLNLLGHQQSPVDARKEGMSLDLVCTIHSESTGRVTREETREQRASVGGHVVRELEHVRQDLLIHLAARSSEGTGGGATHLVFSE